MPDQQRTKNGIPLVKVKHLIPYLLIFIITPTVMYYSGKWLDSFLSFPEFPPLPWNLVSGFSIFFAGLYVGIKSTRTLYLDGKGLPWGEIREETKSNNLVTTGPYSYTRNPMTLGYSMLPLGMGLMFRSPSMALVFPALVLAVEIPLLKLKEEPELEKRFGSQYIKYRTRTPFLLPDPRRLLETRHVQASQMLATNPPRRNPRSSILQMGYLGTSLMGLLLTALLAYSSGTWKVTHPFQREISLSVFLIICFGGTLAALYPSRISRVTHFRGSGHDSSLNTVNNRGVSHELVGHHPPCGGFESHILRMSGRAYCAGCTGLAVGALFAIAGSVLYVFWQQPASMAEAVFWAGVVFVALGLLQYQIRIVRPEFHFIANVIFVIGPFFLLMGVIGLTTNFMVQAYLLSMTLFWILARISLSRIEHDRICGACTQDACAYAYGRQP